MPARILGLDIGGANLKAATADKQAVSVPFPLWKQPEKLPSALTDLVAQFPDVEELAVTMTGELCDCFETKRHGVEAIIAAVRRASGGRTIRVWSTDGVFLDSEEAKRNPMKVAAANWHALATLAGQYVPHGRAILIDVGSTTTDIIPILDGKPVPKGKTDEERLESHELVYTGVRRTPLCALMGWSGAAEFFATTLDAYLTLGLIPEDSTDCDTADGRSATKEHARARLCRMYCGDSETTSRERIEKLALNVYQQQVDQLSKCLSEIQIDLFCLECDGLGGFLTTRARSTAYRLSSRETKEQITYVAAGSGEFLARKVIDRESGQNPVIANELSLSERFGSDLSVCAPAYAIAVLATEGPRTPGGSWLKGAWPWSGRT